MPNDLRHDVKSFEYDYNVSRETLLALLKYEESLKLWNSRINLISKSTEKEIWTRHFRDSAQLFNFLDNSASSLLDIGTGAGFPGMVLAILCKEQMPNLSISLLDESTKRTAFLREVARATRTDVSILNQKIETLKDQKFEIITARAFAPLNRILELSYPYLDKNGYLLLPKGEEAEKELELALKKWSFKLKTHKSDTNPKAAILHISELKNE